MFLFLWFLVKSVDSYGWVPLLDLKSYNTKKPSSIQILNKELVVWEKNDEIIVQDNACIHRKAPLSEGYIDKKTKNLCCSYHGWEYMQNGCVSHIPQMTKNLHNCYKLNTYETIKYNDILWVNVNCIEEQLPYHITNIKNICDGTVVVELPYSMNILLENFFDPAHIPFAHHKLQSFRELASSVNSSLIKMDENMIQFSFEDRTLINNNYRNGTMTFYNPNHYQLQTDYPSNLFIDSLQIYCVPINNYKTRIFMQQTHKESIYKDIYNLLPHFVKHVLTMNFLDSDTFLLYSQQQHLLKSGDFSDSVKEYITPTSSDYSVILFHKWLKKYSPIWLLYIHNQTTSSPLSRQDVLDRYQSHVKNCKYCNAALENINKIQIGLPICIFLVNVFEPRFSFLAFAFGFYLFMENIKSYFIFRDYVHNEI